MISPEEGAAPAAATTSASTSPTSAIASAAASVIHTTAIVGDAAEESEVASPSRSLPLQKRRPRDEEHYGAVEDDAAAAVAVSLAGRPTSTSTGTGRMDVKPALGLALLHPVAQGEVDLHAPDASASIKQEHLSMSLPYPFLAEEPPAKRSRGDSSSNASVTFNDMLYELLKFRAATGNCLVPVKKGGALGRWVKKLRAQYKTQKAGGDGDALDPAPVLVDSSSSSRGSTAATATAAATALPFEGLTPDRVAVLNSLGFTWDLGRSDLEAIWSTRLQELEAFKVENGHCNVSQNASALGRWLKVQREQYRETMDRRAGKPPSVTPEGRLRNALSQDRMDRLEAMGVEWRINPPEVGWESRFQQLVEYRTLHGNCIVPQGYKDNRQLGRWVMKQRTQYTLKQRGQHTQLSDQRVQMLESIGFVWYPSLLRKKSKEDSDSMNQPLAMPPQDESLSQLPQPLLPMPSPQEPQPLSMQHDQQQQQQQQHPNIEMTTTQPTQIVEASV